jgi:hypothetical protein
MNTDQLALREQAAPRGAKPTHAPTPTPIDGVSVPPANPLSILAHAASVRLDDPRDEHERVVAIEVAIIAGRAAAHTLDRWLTQSLAEYRGSQSAWDLDATTVQLRLELDQFDSVLRDMSGRLTVLIPGLVNGKSGPASVSASEPKRQRARAEVSAASRLREAIESRLTAGPSRGD